MSERSRRIVIGRPHLPSLERYREGLAEIWETGWLTNDGPLLGRLESRLAELLGVSELSLLCNGTLALQLGLQALQLEGEVVTTPFTFVATANALRVNGLKPVFADIEAEHYTLDPAAVERAITPRTSAILGVHVYGHPCRHDELAALAERHGLALVYDAAHAFGVTVDGRSVAELGDLSMFSLHATKLFHTIEGGLLVARDPAVRERVDLLRNFGFESETEVELAGTNAKMNELQALMGLLLLDELDGILEDRRRLAAVYADGLAGLPGIKQPAPPREGVVLNHAYAPIEVDPGECAGDRDGLLAALAGRGIVARRYFHPLVTDFRAHREHGGADPLEIAQGVAARVLSLPIHGGMTDADAQLVCETVAAFARGESP